MLDSFRHGAERGAFVISVPEASFVPTSVRPFRLLVDEDGIARPTAVTILFSTRIAVDAPDDRFVATTPPGCFKQAAEAVELVSHLLRHYCHLEERRG